MEEETQDVEVKEEITLENLPISVIREKLDEKGIDVKSTKKSVLIDALVNGAPEPVVKEVKKAPVLPSPEDRTKIVPVVPKSAQARLEELAKSGLTWEIDEENCCINFMRDIPTCANLDQDAKNIILTAEEAFGRRAPMEKGRTDKPLHTIPDEIV